MELIMSNESGLMNRRDFVSSITGLAFAASQPSWAQSATSNPSTKVLFVLLRGAMDGLTAVPAVGDVDFAGLRPSLTLKAPLPLNGDFALHPALTTLHGFWTQNQLNIVHATGFAYQGRSHFEGQDIMQSGFMKPYTSPSGFVGRALEKSGLSAHGVAISIPMPLLLKGSPESSTEYPNWMKPASPSMLRALSDEWQNDSTLHAIVNQLRNDRLEARAMLGSAPRVPFQEAKSTFSLAKLAGERMQAPNGPRAGLIDMQGGFDTHASQGSDIGAHATKLKELDDIFKGFRQGIGSEWSNAMVVTLTEFGRNVKENGNEGTDHGVGSCIFVAGGLLNKSRVITDWRGLKSAQLIDGRDLPTSIDACAVYAKVLERAFSLSDTEIQAEVLAHQPHALLKDWLA